MNVVTVLTPNGRRQNVKCLPNQTIMQILEEVCQKHKFSAGKFDLVHHRRVLDLTLMFRFAGLPNNALLEMREAIRQRVDEDVTLMLQLEDGTRIPGQFKPDQTIDEILVALCPTDVHRTGPNVVCVYMRTEIHGESLAVTTLRSLGLTGGRAIMRLVHKDPESLKVQANVSAPLPPRPVEQEEACSMPASSVPQTFQSAPPANQLASSPEKQQIKVEDPMEVDETRPIESLDPVDCKKLKLEPESVTKFKKEQPEVHVLGYRNAIIFSLDEVPAAEIDFDDSFYTVSVNDLKVLLRDLKCQTQGLDDAPLLTAKMRELDESKKTLVRMTRYKDTVIRVQFPDRLVLQGTFAAVDTVASVMEFVREYIVDPHLDFVLFTTPPKVILRLESTLVESQCVPTALIHFGTTSDTKLTSFLKPECKISTPTAAVLEATKFRGISQDSNSASASSEASGSTGAHGSLDSSKPHQVGGVFKQSSASASGGEKKLPKWFKPTGK